MPRRRTTMTAAAALTLIVGVLSTAGAHADAPSATDLYVNHSAQTCDDGGPGSLAEPFCSIQAAADLVTPGQTVHIEAGSGAAYSGFTLTRSGTTAAPVSFVAEPARAQISVNGPITVDGAHDVSFTGLGSTANSSFPGQSALKVTGSQRIVVNAARFTVYAADPAAAVSVDGASSEITLSRLRITRGAGWGIDVQPGARSIVATGDIITSLGVVAPALGGVHADGVAGITVTGDSVNARCGSAISITGASSGSIENVVAVGAGLVTQSSCTAAGSSASTEIEVSAAAAAQVTSDYNDVYASGYGTAYNWAGTTYPTRAALLAATGQGAHDISSTVGIDPAFGFVYLEGSPAIDSGDADAPGELPTDIDNTARVDDPLVPDTGTGFVDRGAVEFPDQAQVRNWTVPQAYATVPAGITANVTNPWSTPVTYQYDFGDGTVTTSSSATVTHTYATAGVDRVTVHVLGADGATVLTTSVDDLTVDPLPALQPGVGADPSDPAKPDVVTVAFRSSSAFGISDHLVDFGDGSPAQHYAGSTTGATHTYPHPGSYTVKDTVTDKGSRTATGTAQVVVGAAYVPLDPSVRFLNTATGVGAAKKKIGAGGTVRLKIAGVHGIPSSGVSAVTMNVTDTDATADGFVTAYPDGSPRPAVSHLNFKAGQINPNEVTVPVGSDGYVDLYNFSGSVNLLADVQGYYTTKAGASPSQSGLVPLQPTRVLDSTVGPGETLLQAIPRSVLSSIRRDPIAVVLNLTATAGTASSYVAADSRSLYTTPPTTSVLNFRAGQTTSNLVVVPVDPQGQVSLYNHSGRVRLIADVQGYYTDDPSAPYVPVTPTRILDTRNGTGLPRSAAVGPNATVHTSVPTALGVPAGADVLVNLTGTGATADTFLTAYDDDAQLPGTSNLNLVPGQTRPVLTLAPTDSLGRLSVHNHSGNTSVIADLEGYFG
ncbi:PKD domain-containing protein [Streptacidiphilus cavernicola]|uniref:PKD domain-containing protein n=1 Tax=Streptacidiphilus cavernicola TaxID=3342716 RepID=A0ABV6VW01_9ACTN